MQYQEIYPGVDLVFYTHQRQLEYDFVVAPGASLEPIRLKFEGTQQAKLDPAGNLLLSTPGGELKQDKPLIYQVVDGTWKRIEGGYRMEGPFEVGFDVARYDDRYPLVIDPILSYSSYLGGSLSDVGYSIAVDGAGSAYISGTTDSPNFPTQGPIQSAAGDKNGFVTKLSSDGTTILYSTYLGGDAVDEALAIRVDESGNAYLSGYTESTNFPTANAFRANNSGDKDGFVAKLNPQGNALIFSTYLGGSSEDIAYGIDVGTSGNVYVTGSTDSGDFPIANPLQQGLAGGRDGFVAKLNPNGNGLIFSTYLGGSDIDISYSVALDPSDNAYIVGGTLSANFPTTPTATQPAYGGNADVFVSKIASNGGSYIYGTYLGGGFLEEAFYIDVDTQGNAYVAGSTESANFPTTTPLQSTKAFDADVFVTKLNPTGSDRLYSTFLGGNDRDVAHAIAVDPFGNATITGVTSSADFPLLDPILAYRGGEDAFVATLNATGVALVASSYMGGTGRDIGNGVAVTAKGDVFITGLTESVDFPVVSSSFGYSGSEDGFVTKLTDFGQSAHFIPIVLTTTGVNNSFFTSELTLTNRSVQDASLQFTYTQAFGGGSGTATDSLLAGQQRVVDNAIDYLISLGIPIPTSGNRGGTLAVQFVGLDDPSQGSATVRTTTAVADGQAGLSYPGIPTALALNGTSIVPGLRHNDTDRSNLAVQHAGSASQGGITLRMTAISAGGAATFAFPDRILGPGEFYQETGVLAAAGFIEGYVRIEKIGGSAPYYAYGVVNDNANSDGSFIPAIPQQGLAGRTGMTLPVVVEGVFTSELVATNWSTNPKTLRCTYVESVTAPGTTAQFVISLNPGQQTITPDFFESLRIQGTPGIGPKGSTYVGAVFVSIDEGDADGVYVGARTSTPGGGGAYGLFYGAVPFGTASTSSAWLFGLQQNANNRSNLAIVNTGEEDTSASTFDIELYDGNTGARLATDVVTVAAGQWAQIGTVLSQAGISQGYARVVRTTGSNPFITYAVINDGGQPGQRSGDGAWVISSP